MGVRATFLSALLIPAITTSACGEPPGPASSTDVRAPNDVRAERGAHEGQARRANAPSCSHDDVRIVVDREILIPCDPSRVCSMALTFEIENCTSEDVAVASWGVEVGGVAYGFEYDDTPIPIPRQGRTTIRMPADAPYRVVTGTYALRVRLAPQEEASSEARTLEASFLVRDPIKERAKAACLARGGDWLARGHFAGDEICAEVMKDAGKTCQDGRDCQGRCELVSEEVVSATKKRVTGTCSRHRSSLGCYHYIGETQNGLLPRDEPVPRICAD